MGHFTVLGDEIETALEAAEAHFNACLMYKCVTSFECPSAARLQFQFDSLKIGDEQTRVESKK